MFLTLSLVICVVTAWLGQRLHGNPDRFFGEKKIGTLASVAALFGSSFICGLCARRTRGRPTQRFWFFSAGYFAFLALDDLLRIHENIDFLIHRVFGGDRNDPLTTHIDDLIVAAYGVAGMWLGLRYLPLLLRLRTMMQTLFVAALCFGAMVVLDFTSLSKVVEDSLKLIGGTFIALAFLAGYMEIALDLKGFPAKTEMEYRGESKTSGGNL